MDASLAARVETLEKKLHRMQMLALAIAVAGVGAAVFACNREPPSPVPPGPPVMRDGETITLTRGRATLLLAGDRIVMENPASDSSVEVLSDPPRVTVRKYNTVAKLDVYIAPGTSSTVSPPPLPPVPSPVPTVAPVAPSAVPTLPRKPPSTQLGF